MEEIKILEFISSGEGSGNGDGNGRGTICGCSYGSGDGSGYSSGDGSGYSYDDGSGDGSGSGSGDGYAYSDCYGSGYGSGYGDYDGSGFGDCYGSGLKSINGKKIYMIDGIATTIRHIHGNTAKGTIINRDLTETPCYIVKEGKYFAHGKTLAEVREALQDKLFYEMPVEKRIAAFWKCHKKGVKYPTKDFFEWHHKLTRSCLMGRQQFAKDHGVDLDGEMTVEEFIALTKNAFGGDIIKKLEKD